MTSTSNILQNEGKKEPLKTLHLELRSVRHIIDDHLRSINENTSEIQVLFDYLQQIEKKVDKLSQRLDHVQLAQGKIPEKPFISSLNHAEKKIFVIMYTEPLALSCEEISRKTNFSQAFVGESISSLISKGVPLHRSFVQDQFFFSLEPWFKELQAKENLVNLSLQSFME